MNDWMKAAVECLARDAYTTANTRTATKIGVEGPTWETLPEPLKLGWRDWSVGILSALANAELAPTHKEDKFLTDDGPVIHRYCTPWT